MKKTTPSIDLTRMHHAAQNACLLLKTLSNTDRLMLVCQLAQGEKCVGELESLLGIGQPTLSQQLGVLRDNAMVSTRREGKNIYYRIANPKALALIDVLYAEYCQNTSTPAIS
jgi:DNA-binding transcriptional ArsR family regulator